MSKTRSSTCQALDDGRSDRAEVELTVQRALVEARCNTLAGQEWIVSFEEADYQVLVIPRRRSSAARDRRSTPSKPAWVELFLEELKRTGSVTVASELAGISRQSAYRRRDCDASFAQDWKRAKSTRRDSRRHALSGVYGEAGDRDE